MKIDFENIEKKVVEAEKHGVWSVYYPAVEDVKALLNVVDEVKHLHRCFIDSCIECGDLWPCKTAKVLGMDEEE